MTDPKKIPGKCPICKKDRVQEFRPFCSKRCKMVDLGNWMTGKYFIPGEETDQPEDDREKVDESEETATS